MRKKNLPERYHPNRRWLTFMEFIHRQEEKGLRPHESKACRRKRRKEKHPAKPAPLIEVVDLLLASALLFLFITLALMIY